MQNIHMMDLFRITQSLPDDEIILDVRTPDEFQEGHVPGAKNVPHTEVALHADELKKYKKVYIHCRSGGRAQNAWFVLTQQGLTNLVCVGGGGMPDWQAAGYPVEK